MAILVSDLINSSFRLIGAIASAETLETNEQNDAFTTLNQLIASWNTEGLSIAGRQKQTVAITTTNSYSLPTRPPKIEAASVSVAGIDCPLELVDAAGWEAIDEKGVTAIKIRKLFCDYGYPTATVYLWPTPKQAGTLELWTFQTIAPFTSLSQSIDLPPGYEAALRYNLAVALLPEYPREATDPTLPAQAQNYKQSIVALNAANHQKTPPALAAQGAQ